MNVIKFYKDRIVTFVFDEKTDEWCEKNIDDLFQPITFYFGKLVDFDKDLTVFDFINHLNKNREILDAFFLSYNNGISIEKFYKECLEEKEIGYQEIISDVEIAWETDLYKDENINFRFINFWTTFFGRVNEKYDVGIDANIPIRSMNLIRLRNWKHLPLRINRFIYFQEIDASKKRKVYTKLSGIKEFTLMDILCGFLKELAWYGDPEQQLETAKEIEKKFHEMKKEGKDSVTMDIRKPVSKIDLNHLEDELKKCIDEEDYLKAKTIKEKIDIEKKKQEQ